ncbi:hypothetical protein DRV85_06370 [Rhodosalinus halophilus]|uniref:AB hydrolase-1 domain-containing protein n=1 Tax=Rhodosalinus halophilus TaxID=2259333 RepID=A0A365UCY5_9RHOB|nr:alpha/beta hydrolase [Rhodosalinus halophilus]RBI86367.1 hypothetical protein DRV85_06370 [Rhodosalinus halophilus]
MGEHFTRGETTAGRAAPGAQGGPVVMLHGLLESPALWEPLSEALDLGEHYAPPLPGHRGDAARLPQALPLLGSEVALARHMADEIETRTGGRRVRLIGHSLGGYLALLIARERPELVERVMVVGAIHAGDCGKRPSLRTRVVTGMPLLGPVSAQVLMRRWLADADRFAAWMTSSLAPGERLRKVPAAMRTELATGSPRTIQALAAWARGQSALDSFRSIERPVTVVICARDPVVAFAHQMALARELPAAVARIADTGHLPMLTAPRRFAMTVRAWLDDAAAPTEGCATRAPAEV